MISEIINTTEIMFANSAPADIDTIRAMSAGVTPVVWSPPRSR